MDRVQRTNKIEISEKFSFGSILPEQKETARKLVSDYVGESDGEKFNEYFESHPNLAVGCTNEKGEIVGVCFGFPRDEETVLLQGIAIHSDYSGSGLGSKLIKLFEDAVIRAGYHKITLGSAEGYVEHFYLKNGYRPVEYMIEVEGDDEIGPPEGFEVKGSRKEGNKTIFYISNNNGYQPEQKDLLKKHFGVSKVIFLFEKEL